MAFTNPLNPPPVPMPWGWTYDTRPIIPTCEHCYCADDDGILSIRPKVDHLKCCKCGDTRHKKFVNGGTESDNTKKL